MQSEHVIISNPQVEPRGSRGSSGSNRELFEGEGEAVEDGATEPHGHHRQAQRVREEHQPLAREQVGKGSQKVSPVFQHQEESPTRAEGCQRSADLKSEECARPRTGVSQSAKVGGKNPPSGKQDCATKVSTKPKFVGMSSSRSPFQIYEG